MQPRMLAWAGAGLVVGAVVGGVLIATRLLGGGLVLYGFPPYTPGNYSSWLVYSCDTSTRVCTVPVKFDKPDLANDCGIVLPRIIEFEHDKTEVIAWQIDPGGYGGDTFEFAARRIEVLDNKRWPNLPPIVEAVIGNPAIYEDDGTPTSTETRKRRKFQLVRLSSYDIYLNRIHAGATTPCKPYGPLIVNRG